MAASGVKVNQACIDEFNKIKIGKKYQYVQFKLTDDMKEIEVEKTVAPSGDETAMFEAFVAQLPEEDCRYAIYDFHYSLGKGAGDRQQLLFVVWCPDVAKVKKKMLYASSKDALKKALVGLNHEIQATEPAELDRKDIEERVKSKQVK